MFGLKKRDNGYSNDWMSFYPQWQKPSFKVSLGGYFDNRVEIVCSPGWGWLFLNLPIRTKYDECDPPTYGFYLYGEGKKLFDSIVLCLGRKRKFIYMPWSMKWYRTSKLKKDGNFEHGFKGNIKDFYKMEWKDVIKFESFPYKYVLESGEVQNRVATISVSEMEWRPKWFMWTPLFSNVERYIDIEFDGEVGERSGSWKGGTIGCSYKLLKNETTEECLKRMEKERKF